MKGEIRDQASEWIKIILSVLQGSVLAPLMFLIYLNNMVERVGSYTSLFASDAKVMQRVGEAEDCQKLEEDIDIL